MSELSHYANHKVRINALTSAIDQAIDEGAEEANREPTNYFAHGVYGRELLVKAGTLASGKIHRYSCITIILYGRCRVLTDQGDFDVTGPKVLVTGTGSKGVYAYEDTLWFTAHPNTDNGQDMGRIENNVIAPSYEALENGVKL
jgi:hypothetical protein